MYFCAMSWRDSKQTPRHASIKSLHQHITTTHHHSQLSITAQATLSISEAVAHQINIYVRHNHHNYNQNMFYVLMSQRRTFFLRACTCGHGSFCNVAHQGTSKNTCSTTFPITCFVLLCVFRKTCFLRKTHVKQHRTRTRTKKYESARPDLSFTNG